MFPKILIVIVLILMFSIQSPKTISSDELNAQFYVANDFSSITEVSMPKPTPTPTPRKICQACNGTGKSGDGQWSCGFCNGTGYEQTALVAQTQEEPWSIVYQITDPNCGPCRQDWETLKDWIAASGWIEGKNFIRLNYSDPRASELGASGMVPEYIYVQGGEEVNRRVGMGGKAGFRVLIEGQNARTTSQAQPTTQNRQSQTRRQYYYYPQQKRGLFKNFFGR